MKQMKFKTIIGRAALVASLGLAPALIACGGGGGNSPAAKKAKKERKAKVKLSFLKKKLAEAAAAGEPTSDLQDKIDALEASLEKN